MSEQTPPEQGELDKATIADKYDRMMRLADHFDGTGEEMRERSRLGQRILADEDVSDSAPLSPKTWETAESDIRAAMTGKQGLEAYSLELDADALVVRATVLTYRWIDELQEAAYRTLGSIAGRAIGYLAPEIELGGAILSAGLIETDALDREGVAAYLNELAETHPDLMDHLTGGGGGMLESLQLRSMLTANELSGDSGAAAARGGLRAAGVEVMDAHATAGLRDAAGAVLAEPAEPVAADLDTTAGAPPGSELPRNLEELMTALVGVSDGVALHEVAPRRFIAYLPGPTGGSRLRLVGSDRSGHTREVRDALVAGLSTATAGTRGDGPVRVMLVGCGAGGVAAAEIAAEGPQEMFEVDQVVVAGAPSAQVSVIPESTRVLTLEDRADPVALLGSLINDRVSNRLTVVYDGGDERGPQQYVAGGRAADGAAHDALRGEIARLQDLGYLAG